MPMMPNLEIENLVVNEESYPDQVTIYKDGSHGKWVYVILEGKVKLKKKTAKGMMTIDTLGEGALLGDSILWQKADEGRQETAVADGPVVLGLLDTNQLVQEVTKMPLVMREFITALSKRINTSLDEAVKLMK